MAWISGTDPWESSWLIRRRGPNAQGGGSMGLSVARLNSFLNVESSQNP